MPKFTSAYQFPIGMSGSWQVLHGQWRAARKCGAVAGWYFLTVGAAGQVPLLVLPEEGEPLQPAPDEQAIFWDQGEPTVATETPTATGLISLQAARVREEGVPMVPVPLPPEPPGPATVLSHAPEPAYIFAVGPIMLLLLSLTRRAWVGRQRAAASPAVAAPPVAAATAEACPAAEISEVVATPPASKP